MAQRDRNMDQMRSGTPLLQTAGRSAFCAVMNKSYRTFVKLDCSISASSSSWVIKSALAAAYWSIS